MMIMLLMKMNDLDGWLGVSLDCWSDGLVYVEVRTGVRVLSGI
jgi:hypothetical protein